MSSLSTHILDTSLGQPARGVTIVLTGNQGAVLARGVTDADGRVGGDWAPALEPGVYALHFAVGDYFAKRNIESFYPSATVEFRVSGDPHYHVPLLLNPFGYSTYRGS